MTDATVDDEDLEEKKPSKLPMIIGVVLALAGGGGGFFAVQSGMLGGGGEETHEVAPEAEEIATAPLPDVAFVEVPQVTISLKPGAAIGHLRFRASLEVPSQHVQEVTDILPRVQDVMNSYLRALEPTDFEQSAALIRIRAQLLRRIKLVAGEGRVRDLLILEFVLN
jgi:flagellar FliL protein